VVDIFDEVDQDLRAERARRMFGRYGWLLAVIVVLLVGGVSAWQVWQTRQQSRDEAAAAKMLAAMRLAEPIRPGAADGPARDAATRAFEDVAASSPEGYRTLARLRIAALRDGAGDEAGALAEWDEVANDAAAPALLRGLADLLWARRQVDSGDPAAVEARLRPLMDQSSAWRPLAAESLALLDMRIGKDDAARDELRRLAADPVASPGVRSRANGLLSRLGADPAQDSAAESAAAE
jgi:hypothetical protein